MTPFIKVYEIVSSIPKGKVTTYGAIAKMTGLNPKVVGFALHANKDIEHVPCHRVVKSDGTLAKGYAFGGLNVQKEILEHEGIIFDKNGKTDLEKFGFRT